MPTPSVPNLAQVFEDDPIEFDLTTAWMSFTCKLDWLTRLGYCSTVVLAQTVVLNGSGLHRHIRFCCGIRPSLWSLSGKTLDVQGRKPVQLDCGNGHSLRVQFYVCTAIPQCCTAVVARFLDCNRERLPCVIDPTGNPVPIARQGTVVYLTPTVIPYAVANAARLAASCFPEVMSGMEKDLGAWELRGVSDVHCPSVDHLCQIGALIAAAQGMKSSDGVPMGHLVKKKDRQPVIQIGSSCKIMATENDLSKENMVLNATAIQTGYSMAVVLPSKGSVEKYAVAELRIFLFETGRTFGIFKHDKEAPLKTVASDLYKTVGRLSMCAAPTGHFESQGSVGTPWSLYAQL